MPAGKTSTPEGPARRVSFSELLGGSDARGGNATGPSPPLESRS